MLSAWRSRRLSRKTSSSSSVASDDSSRADNEAKVVPTSVSAIKLDFKPIENYSADVWATDDIDIAVTNVVMVPSDPSAATHAKVAVYEISTRFPNASRLWRVQRSLAEFHALHAALEKLFGALLHDRDIHLPKASWISWDFRSSSASSTASGEQTATALQFKLNTYLSKIVAIEAVTDHTMFQDFLTPRPTSSGDMELRSKMLPTLAIASATTAANELLNMKTMGSPSTTLTDTCAPPVKSQCTEVIHFGSGIQLHALGGLHVGLTKRGGLTGSQKAVAVAAGVAGIALTGPLSAALAIGAVGGGVGKYQMSKSFCLSVNKPRNTAKTGLMKSIAHDKATNGWFIIDNAELVSGPRRALKFGDLLHLFCRNVRKSVRITQPVDSKHGHLMVTNAESKRATLRLVSPYGYRGNVVCGSHVYIQMLNGQWAGQYISMQGDFLATGNSPTVFKICQQDHACLASEEINPITRPISHRSSFQLRVMAYNVWLLPSILSSMCPATMTRAQAIPKCIAPYDVDVVVFCEAFCANAREVLVKGMKEQGYLYETRVVGEGASVSTKKAIDGGCFAMSKYPMEHFEEFTFGSAAVGDDRMADKGVIYFQLRMAQGGLVHVFGTHLQAWESKVAIAARKAQLKLLHTFIQSKKISPLDAVVIAGDLNVDQFSGQSVEYDEMLELLQAEDSALRPSSSKFSFDPSTNRLAMTGPSSSGRTEKLDYVLTARHHRQPSQRSAEVIILKATKQYTRPRGVRNEELVDLSDHYPVMAEFHFDADK